MLVRQFLSFLNFEKITFFKQRKTPFLAEDKKTKLKLFNEHLHVFYKQLSC